MLNKAQKKQIVTDLTQQFREAKAAVFSDFQGLPAKDIQEVRAKLGAAGIMHKVVKLTLVKKALAAAGIETEKFNFQVPVAVSLSKDDEVAPAKILSDYAKINDKLKVLAGVLGNRFIDLAEVKALASLPGKQELLGQLVGVLAGPLRGMVSVLSGNLRGLMSVLNAIKEKKGV